MKRILLFCLAVLIGAVGVPSAQAAEPGCKKYKVNAPILYVHRNIGQSGDYLGQIESGTVACISHQVNTDNQQWGFITHKQQASGQNEPVNGWIRLEFMTLQSQAGAAPPASSPVVQQTPPPQVAAAPPAPTPAVQPARPPAPQLAGNRPNAIAPSCPPGFVLTAGQCKRPAVTAPAPSCPAGFVFSQGKCVASSARPSAGSNVAIAPAGTSPAGAGSLQQQLNPRDLTIAIQQELTRLGCNPGPADGDWGRRTVNAITAFNRQTNLSLDAGKPGENTLPVLKSTAGAICTSSSPQVKPVSTGYTAPKKKTPKTVKKKAPPKKKVKTYRGGEGARLDCESGRKVTNECF